MTRRAYFAYQQGLRGPAPVVIFDAIPDQNGKLLPLLRSWEIEGGTDAAFFFPEGTDQPDMGRLQRFFPFEPDLQEGGGA